MAKKPSAGSSILKKNAPAPDRPGLNDNFGYWLPVDQIDTLESNPENWRKHPERQMRAISTSIKENGWAGALLYNEVTGRLIDGHARKELVKQTAKEAGMDRVPVIVGRWTLEQERRILATLDPIAAMAEADHAMLKSLTAKVSQELESISSLDVQERQDFERELAKIPQQQIKIESAMNPINPFKKNEDDPSSFQRTPNELPGVMDVKDDLEFEFGINPYDIPQMRSDMLGDCPEPIKVWTTPDDPAMDVEHYMQVIVNGNTRNLPWEQSVVCFYTEDQWFRGAWEDAGAFVKRLMQKRPYACVAPDFSTNREMSKAYRIWTAFRQRWVSRYWQECGIKVIPSISEINHDADEEFHFAGIPQNPPCISMEFQNRYEDEDNTTRNIRLRGVVNRYLKHVKPQSLIVYGGKPRDEFIDFCQFPKQLHVISIENYITAKSRFLETRKVANSR